MWNKLKEHYANWLLGGLLLYFLYHFYLLWRYGRFLVFEDNLYIRGIETAAVLFCFFLVIERDIDDWLKRDSEEK